MPQFQNISIQISKFTDQLLIDKIKEALTASELQTQDISVQPEFSGNSTRFSTEKPPPPEIAEVLSLNTFAIIRLDIETATTLSISFRRQPNQPSDNVSINFSESYRESPPNPSHAQVIKLTGHLREHLRAVDFLSTEGLRSVLSPELHKHYEFREAAVAKLEATIAQIASQITEDARKVRAQLDIEYQARTEMLNASHAKEVEKFHSEIALQQERLEKQRLELETKLREIDHSKSTHARRKLRQDLKQELAKRSVKFQLTEGTRDLRLPIFLFTIFLLVVSFTGLATYSVLSATLFAQGTDLADRELIATTIKQIAFAIAFASTSLFFLRWNNRWFQAHADEEFRQKQFDLDLDRASWVVEMALEWKEEKGSEIPSELLSRLTNGLFVADSDHAEEALHPADQLASAILGASSGASIEVPGGTKVQFDRKGIKRLQKSTQK
ncbi:hypothetical protein JYK02_16545 [Corallococcus macrosporus]|uniref:Uncharacterized protein n=1 Tax=Corallococcus macrosporus TaxID=35 RepID=A0ABS3DBQ4_9BACT|nr:hypothetical protein [Corallococcus macrosporus]MBN8229119.1 hypothetical protein [Corallococcus macrosporus]